MKHRTLPREWAAIDIGTTKICALIARLSPKGGVEVIGIGQSPSLGLKKGVVVDVPQTVDSIKKAVAQAASMAGVAVHHVVVGISGGHIQSFNSNGVVAVKNHDISQEDIDRVIEAAKAIPIPSQREILHVLPQYFKVDGHDVVQNSLGMKGVRLEAQVHIITGNISSASNIIHCCEKAGILATDIVLEQLASAHATLTDSECDLGVGILDIGGGTADFAIYKDGRVRHSKVIPIAGNHFTNDLSICLGVDRREAEELKCKYGAAMTGSIPVDPHDDIVLKTATTQKTIQPQVLVDILQSRAQELFDIVVDEMIEFNLKPFMPYGLVLTGGGSLLPGMVDLARTRFGMPARIGIPHDTLCPDGKGVVPDILKSPVYSTGYGLLLHAAKEQDRALTESRYEPLYSRVFKRMKTWIYDFI